MSVRAGAPVFQLAAYALLAALDAWTTSLALSASGEDYHVCEVNRLMAPFIHQGRFLEAALISVAALAPFSLLTLSKRPLVPLFERALFASACAFRALVSVNNILVAVRGPALPLYAFWESTALPLLLSALAAALLVSACACARRSQRLPSRAGRR